MPTRRRWRRRSTPPLILPSPPGNGPPTTSLRLVLTDCRSAGVLWSKDRTRVRVLVTVRLWLGPRPRAAGDRHGWQTTVSEELFVTSTPVQRFRPSRTGHAVLDLLDQSRGCLAEAASATTATQRFAAAHLAALRAGAAVLAARARSEAAGAGGSRRARSRGPRSVWAVLAEVAPELAEWAGCFAAGAARAGRCRSWPAARSHHPGG